MTANGIVQLLFYLGALLLLAWPLGNFMARVYELPASSAPLRPLAMLERGIYRLCGIRADEEMSWRRYGHAVLAFNLLGLLAVYALLRLQASLPFNPQAMAGVTPDLAFNTAVSFASNTNWQAYGGETTLSYLTQMMALTVQNFVSAATGMAVLVAMVRGFVRREMQSIGNFWVDMVRSTLYILLPLSLLLAVVLSSQGVVQSFSPYQTVQLLQEVEYEEPVIGSDGQPLKDDQGQAVMERKTTREQLIPLGPAASQIAIKQLGTNGGGFFNVNSAHPLENPTPLSNFLELLAILLIPAALCITFGRMVSDVRQGRAILTAMTIIFVLLLGLCV
ncbi:MAG: potassium-transporting ATPase subunit KdpA, partial [Magnetococcales bacterium]|nr:potassium-transporting ATPase subunit KdpA [Magnetococcales bacterium]